MDIRELNGVEIRDMQTTIKRMTKLKELSITSCYMTPEILSKILDAVYENFESRPDDEGIE